MSSKPTCLCLSDLSHCRKARDFLQKETNLILAEPTRTSLEKHLPEADLYFAGLKVRLDDSALKFAKHLKIVATPSTGLDHLDMKGLEERGIPVLGLKNDIDFLNEITATAEMAWGLLLSVLRKIPHSFQAACEGQWARDRFRGHQISGKTLGILGYGRLGRMVAEYGKAFRMQVIACDVRDFESDFVAKVSYTELLKRSDVLSIHIHLTDENRGYVSREALAQMKKDAVIVNTSRGAIIDEEALLEALESGGIAGAGVDVIEGEWREDLENHPLIRYANTHENLVISPHTGGITYESQEMSHMFTAEKLIKYYKSIG